MSRPPPTTPLILILASSILGDLTALLMRQGRYEEVSTVMPMGPQLIEPLTFSSHEQTAPTATLANFVAPRTRQAVPARSAGASTKPAPPSCALPSCPVQPSSDLCSPASAELACAYELAHAGGQEVHRHPGLNIYQLANPAFLYTLHFWRNFFS